MYKESVKNLYIGKSKLKFISNNREIPGITIVQDVFQDCGQINTRMPSFGTYGNFIGETFEITLLMPSHSIYITGIPNGEVLDNYRLLGVIWSSYYEDDTKGYLFQILPVNQVIELIHKYPMEVIDYIKMFKMDQPNFEFNREEFIDQFGKDFIEYCENTTVGINPETKKIHYLRFKEVIRNFETKFWEISQMKSGMPLSRKLWNTFYAIKIVPLRTEWYPEMQSKIERRRAQDRIAQDRNAYRDKNISDGNAYRDKNISDGNAYYGPSRQYF